MRTIKFRVWNTTRKEMLFNVNIPYNFQSKCGDGVWMQFTGLLDKNGKEIYEGDILSPGYTDEEYFIVVFDTSRGARFAEQRVKPGIKIDTNYIMDGSFLAYRKLEIIGNIYESPDLLKQGE